MMVGVVGDEFIRIPLYQHGDFDASVEQERFGKTTRQIGIVSGEVIYHHAPMQVMALFEQTTRQQGDCIDLTLDLRVGLLTVALNGVVAGTLDVPVGKRPIEDALPLLDDYGYYWSIDLPTVGQAVEIRPLVE
jgi:hypothetical protein